MVDGVIPLDSDGVGVIRNTLAILASKEIKLTSCKHARSLTVLVMTTYQINS